MENEDLRLLKAARDTYIVRPPRQTLATFGVTVVRYFVVTDPVFGDFNRNGEPDETVVREGVVTAARPQVVTPLYLTRHEGFGDKASRYLREMLQQHGPDSPGLLYSYRNDPEETSIVSGRSREVARRIADRLDKEKRNLEAVIHGVDELWDVSLMKFIYELTNSSVRSNASELHRRGLLEVEGGVPLDARRHISWLMTEAQEGRVDPGEIHNELERWDLFDEYQDQFFKLFKKK